MKRFAILLGVLTIAVYSYAQTLESDSISLSPPKTPYELAEEAYARYFAQKTDSSSVKDELYQTLMDCFTDYVKCMDDVDEAQQANMKEKIRRLRPEFEKAGIEYSSKGNNQVAYKFLECYLNIPNLPFFEGEQFPQGDQFPAYVFIVAAESHNSHDFETAVNYLKDYIELGEKRNQQICYEFLASDLELLKRYDEEMEVLDEGIMNYPQSLKMMKRAINLYTQFGDKDKANEMFNKAIALAPDDFELLRFKADIDYQNDRFADALPVYTKYYEQNPNDPNRAKTLAFCHFNLAGSLVNDSNGESDADKYGELRGQATEHFNKCIALLESLSKNSEVVRDDPSVISVLTEAMTHVGRSSDADLVRQNASRLLSVLSDSVGNSKRDVPNFNEWYKPKLDNILAEWERRGEFEPAEEYVKRVNVNTRNDLILLTMNSLESDYIREYSDSYNLEEITIKPYDPDHQTYCIRTKQGDIYLRVPLAGDEAKKFKENWSGVKIQSPQFRIDKSGNLKLATAVFATPDGHYYPYDANVSLVYKKVTVTKPQWKDEDAFAIIAENDKQGKTDKPDKPNKPDEEPINVGESTVDVNVPKNKGSNPNVFALIIANENYKNENVENVPFALNDGKSFKRYCEDVLCIDPQNIVTTFNATKGEMIAAVDRIKDLEASFDNIKLLVYYSGHGLPDPGSQEAYLVPVDASPRNMSTSYKLSDFYQELSAHNPASVTVFLDACFSGAKKDGQVIDREARGLIITPVDETPAGNMVIFAACSGNETAYPFNNEKHGMFTFFLLKKLQEDKGKTKYKDLADYIVNNVLRTSVRYYTKQNPSIRSTLPESEWGNWKLLK